MPWLAFPSRCGIQVLGLLLDVTAKNNLYWAKWLPLSIAWFSWLPSNAFDPASTYTDLPLLEDSNIRDGIAQASHTYTKANEQCLEWDGLLHPLLALYSSWSPWLIQTIWDNSSPTTDQPCRLITTLLLLVLHFYDDEQPNAPPSTTKSF